MALTLLHSLVVLLLAMFVCFGRVPRVLSMLVVSGNLGSCSGQGLLLTLVIVTNIVTALVFTYGKRTGR